MSVMTSRPGGAESGEEGAESEEELGAESRPGGAELGEEEELGRSRGRWPTGGVVSVVLAPAAAPQRSSNLLASSVADASRDTKNKNIKSHSIHGMGEEDRHNRPHQEMGQLSFEEKKFLLSVERGDVAGVRRILVRNKDTGVININCMDPLGRSALLMAIDNENLEMVELLIEYKVETKDALLHAISEEYVEAVEVLLDHEETIHIPGEPHSWEAIPPETATFTPDITPLILAAHRDNYEIIKILLDRGATLPGPHDLRCGCEDCVTSRQEDSLRHSRSRINAYRALASPSLIALSSKDPILTAFELSWELRRLSFMEHEFRSEYQELRKQVQDFATALLDHTRSSFELEVLLNHDPTGPPHEHGERMHLNRLKLAIKLKQKKFVAHPNVQQLLASIWYEGLPGFRRKNMALQALEIVKIGLLFPIFSIVYILAPHTSFGQTMRKPFIKFICHSASYLLFLFLLILASQRIETVIVDWIGVTEMLKKWVATDVTTRRGAPPSLVEWLILAWVFGLIWSEIKQLWDVGLREYVADMWNVIDFITNALYVATIALRIVAYYQVQYEIEKELDTHDLPRQKWDTWDPMLIAEGLFAAANIFSSLKLVYIFSVNPYLGPLQVSLSRMVVDILKFIFLYLLTLFAFSCGMNQLLWFYADLEKEECNRDRATQQENFDSCIKWRRFSNLFETTQTLFWAAFGLIDLTNFELAGIKPFTRFWGMLMFGTYSVINVIVLLNLLIAMMNHSYQLVSERADTEWKFARSKLWISYFEEGGTCPPPFNIIPTPKSLYYLLYWFYKKFCGQTKAAKKEHMRTIRNTFTAFSPLQRIMRLFTPLHVPESQKSEFKSIMRNLVRRYVTVEQRKAENQGVTEDDVNEIKQDISAFRCELVEILKNSGMNTSSATAAGQGILPRGSTGGKKNRQKERRLMKGFNLGVNSLAPHFTATVLPATTEVAEAAAVKRSPQNKLARLARLAEARLGRPTNKKRWGTLVEAAKTANVKKLLSRSHSDESLSSDPGNEITGDSEDAHGGCGTPTPLQNLPPSILRNPDGSSEGSRRERGNLEVSGTMHLDAAALVSQQDPVKRPPKNSVSFDQSAVGGVSSSSPSHSSAETEPPPPYSPWPRPPASTTATTVTEPTTTTATSPSSGGSGSLPPMAISESSEPLVDSGRPANGLVQAPCLPGIQPVNRHMTAGWL
ncbi:transient receptor potential-gamma protein-like isoform X6 [Macrobrachium rosenbergii]|uniref:transient receptor potential-gamma protein-like isoform X6 n=1 Tax=Macrobrachium rosenbergii TaxID=79674 RepID=UPI0034D7570F